MIQVIRTVNSSAACTRLRMTGPGWKNLMIQSSGGKLNHQKILYKSTLASHRTSSVSRTREQEQEIDNDTFIEPENGTTTTNVSKITAQQPAGVNPTDVSRRVQQHHDDSGTIRHKMIKPDTSGSNYFNYNSDGFVSRHIGPREKELDQMANVIGYKSLDDLINATVPSSIRCEQELDLNGPMTESQLIERLHEIGSKNRSSWKSFIGMGYYNCHTPPVIMRNVLENPGKLLSITVVNVINGFLINIFNQNIH